MYYPVDDAIRNRRKLILLIPEYCDILSLILKPIFKRITKLWSKDEVIIPKKGEILQDMKNSIL